MFNYLKEKITSLQGDQLKDDGSIFNGYMSDLGYFLTLDDAKKTYWFREKNIHRIENFISHYVEALQISRHIMLGKRYVKEHIPLVLIARNHVLLTCNKQNPLDDFEAFILTTKAAKMVLDSGRCKYFAVWIPEGNKFDVCPEVMDHLNEHYVLKSITEGSIEAYYPKPEITL